MMATIARFWREYWAVIGLAAGFALFVLALVMGEASTTRRVPLAACNATYTGRTAQVPVTTYVCSSYNKDGACVVNVPITTYHTSNETRVVCDFTEWS